MNRALVTTALVSLFIGTTGISSLAATEHQSHHPGGGQPAATTSSKEMTEQQGMTKMPCLAGQAAGSMSQMMEMMGHGMGDMMGAGMSDMMGAGKMGMMEKRMKHTFFLDRADVLGLSATQVSKLKVIFSDCRKDNIRNTAEVRIARLELGDLLAGDDWSMKDAESRVRKVQKLESDIQIRHLQALSDARKVLTAEQRQQVRSGDDSDNPRSLFQ